MSAHHHHAAARTTPARLLIGAVAAVMVAALVGLVVLWPRGEAPDLGVDRLAPEVVPATVTAVTTVECLSLDENLPTTCQRAFVDVEGGAAAGTAAAFDVPHIDFRVPELAPGDRVLLLDNPMAPPEFRFTFFEFERNQPIWVLAAVFAVVVLVVGRWRGLRALAGLAASLGVLTWFLLPSLLRDNSPIAVALVSCVLIAFVGLYLAHGFNLTATIALAGTIASLGITTTLAVVFVQLARLTGLGDADAQILRLTAEALDPQGLLIAGIVIGALGVLDDVTVTQVSAVAEMRRAMPEASNRHLYSRAMRIGRDHVASVVNTLVLAYAGASLYLLLFFVQWDEPLARTLGREVVAVEIVRTLVGGTGLVLAVPITTALAAALLVAPRTAGDEPPQPEAPPRAPRWEDFGPVEPVPRRRA
jgi:uncharacterized membrane protein